MPQMMAMMKSGSIVNNLGPLVLLGARTSSSANERSEQILRDCVAFADEDVRAPSKTKGQKRHFRL